MVNYWLMTAKDHRGRDGKPVPARAIVERRVANGIWFVSYRNPYLRKVTPGDLGIMLALGKERKEFLGDCKIVGGPHPVDAARAALVEGPPSSALTHYLTIEGRLWPQPKDLMDYVGRLSFVGEPSRWYVYFQGGLKPLTEADVAVLLSR